MRLVARIAAIAAAFIAALVVSAVVLIYFNQHRIIVAVLASIKNHTGVEIISPSSHIQVRNHLIVELDHPRVTSGNGQVVVLERVRAVVNFRSIFTHGLPFRELDFERPSLTLPVSATSMGAGPLPRPDREMIDRTLAHIGGFARISGRLVINNLELRDPSGMLLLRDVQLVAYHRRSTPKLWAVAFEADCEFPKLAGTHAAGNFKLGAGGALPALHVLQGKLWFWKLPLQHLAIGNLQATGQSQGLVSLSVTHNGNIEGDAAIGLKALTIISPDLSSPLALGDATLEARFSTSTDQVTISNARLTYEGKPFAAGQVYIGKPFEPNPNVTVGVGGLAFDWKDVLAPIRSLKRVPQQLEALVRQMKSGKIQFEKVSLQSSLAALENMKLESILKQLSVTATLTDVSFALPPETQLPDVTGASVQILFAKQILSAIQGTAKIGNSELHDLDAQIDLSTSLEEVPYQISTKADLDLAELRPAAVKLLDQFKVHERDRLQAIRGAAQVDLEASGVLRKDRPTRPEKYLVKIEPHGVTVGFRGAPGPIGIASGSIIVQPAVIRLEKVSARATGGTADFDG
jgi:hypothetical protein